MLKKENRALARTVVSLPGKLLLDGNERPLEIRVVDVSSAGVGLIAKDALPVNSGCAISLDIPSRIGHQRVNAWCRVIHSKRTQPSHFRCGLKFADMDGYSGLLLRELSALNPFT